jgi:hypothetical protein
MAISQAAGSPFNNYGTSLATLAVTPVTVGDYLLFGAKASSDSVTITGVSGGGVTTWTQLVVANDTTDNGHEEIWGGVVTATGSQTITATYGSVPGVSCDLWASELVWSGGVGTWSLATSGLLVNLSTTISWPSLTSGTGANQAYWGINRSAQSTSPGSTSGFSYTTNANDNLECFNGTLSASTAYQPTASQSPSGAAFNTAVIMSVASGYTGTGTGTVSVSGTATGVVRVPATASGTVSVSGAAAGAYPGLYAGAAAGHVTVAGTALGYSSISPPPVYHPQPNVWAEAIFADELQIVTVGEVYAGINGSLLATINNITNGTVKIDQTNANRRTCSDILMAIDASTTYLVPGVNSGDLFPDGGELFLQKGIVYPDGTTEMKPLGRFLIETPNVTRAVNGAGSLVIDLSGTDRSGTVARSLFTQPYATDGVSTVDVAIMAILNMQVPQLTAFAFAASPLVPPVASYAVGDNAWTACQALAALDSKELFFEPSVNAVCILRDIPDATVAPIAATYNADLSSIITQNTRGLSNVGVPNVILTQSQGSGVAIPLQAMWFDNNPLSPTYYGPAGPPVPPVGTYPTTVVVITVSGITDLPALQAMANTAGAAQQGRFETCDTYIRDDPARDASDVVTINDPVLNMEANFVLDSLVVQMGYSTAMEIVGRRVY